MDEVVETSAGRLRGAERRGIRFFRGIPFARPPLGPLRFRPPEPAPPWTGVREARRPGPAAPQPAMGGSLGRFLPTAGRRSEDCLTLNVWTPACDGGRRPVLVWIHGGAFVLGSGSTPLYSGRRLARRGDCVVVTIQYRLGALGFLQMTDVTGPEGAFASNLGLLDQIAALRWVRENAAAFGGDPQNVTIFGESAGAMSVGTLLGTPGARGLFRRAILQSGAAHNVSSREGAERVAETLLGELGLSRERAERLREVPVAVLLAAQMRTSLQLGLGHGTLPWQPAVDGDVVPEPPLDAIARGAARGVSVLVGTNADEWKLFLLGDRRARAMDEAALRRRFGRALEGTPDGSPLVERALAAYPAGPGRRPVDRWCAFQGDRVFRWPAVRLADLQSAHERDTYAYLFDWSPWLLRRRVGACHAIELPLLFGTFRHPFVRPLYGASRAVRALARSLQEAWCAFARHGDPNHGAFPEWPAWDARRRTLVRVGAKSAPEPAPDPDALRFWSDREAGAAGASRPPHSSAPKTES